MESGPLVSAVVPTYGRPEYLGSAVRSVAAQTYDPIELIVVDDCSPDPVAPHLDELDLSGLDRVVVRRHETNRGANAARNTGIEEARGEFVAFLDDDDRWKPRKIAAQMATFRAAPDSTGVVYTGLDVVDEAGDAIGRSIRSHSGDVTRTLLCGASIVSITRLLVRRDALDAVVGLDESLPGWQDRDLNIRLSRECRYEPVTDPLAVHRRGNHDQIGDEYEGKRDEAYPRLVSKHRSLAAEYGAAVERRFLATQTLALAKAALASDRPGAARKHLLAAIRHDPRYWQPYAYVALTGGQPFYRGVKTLKRYVERVLGTVSGTDRPTAVD
jgi:glycosyltransferase involved in cell wall biosynthesis